ncbi:hypothetical protein ACWCXX_38975 [Streptomyces sp. NPDC001732]
MFDGQLPETLATMSVVDELQPALSVGLHNADTGGCFLMASRPEPGPVGVLAGASARVPVSVPRLCGDAPPGDAV